MSSTVADASAVGPPDGLSYGQVHCGDSLEILKAQPNESVHAIISDIPYGIGAEAWDVLHANSNSAYRGSSPAQEQAGAIFKTRGKPINGWSASDRAIPREYYEWCSRWASSWYRVLKPGGTVLVFAGRRLSHRCVAALEDTGFSVKDQIAWIRPRATHRAQRLSVVYERRGDGERAAEWAGWKVGNLRPSFEPIIWAVKPYRIGGTIADNVIAHGTGAYNEQAYAQYSETVSNFLTVGMASGEGGLHPTQKPLKLMRGLVDLVTKPGQVVLDPFAGSGTTLAAAKAGERDFIGVEIDPAYAQVANDRLGVAEIDDSSEDSGYLF